MRTVFEDDVVVIEDDRWAAVYIDVEVLDHLAVVVRVDGAVVAGKRYRYHSFPRATVRCCSVDISMKVFRRSSVELTLSTTLSPQTNRIG